MLTFSKILFCQLMLTFSKIFWFKKSLMCQDSGIFVIQRRFDLCLRSVINFKDQVNAPAIYVCYIKINLPTATNKDRTVGCPSFSKT